MREKIMGYYSPIRNSINIFFLRHFSWIQDLAVRINFPKKKYDIAFTLIAGCPRAGTSLLDSILSIHPDLDVGYTEMDLSSLNLRKYIH